MEFSDCGIVEEFSEVDKIDEKDAIFLLLHVKLFNKFWSPFIRVIRPVTEPFDLAPRIPDF